MTFANNLLLCRICVGPTCYNGSESALSLSLYVMCFSISLKYDEGSRYALLKETNCTVNVKKCIIIHLCFL